LRVFYEREGAGGLGGRGGGGERSLKYLTRKRIGRAGEIKRASRQAGAFRGRGITTRRAYSQLRAVSLAWQTSKMAFLSSQSSAAA